MLQAPYATVSEEICFEGGCRNVAKRSEEMLFFIMSGDGECNNLMVFGVSCFMELVNSLDPRLREFILFCVERRGSEWPAIYDEMTRVAGQRLFEGLGYTELKQLGLSLAASNLDKLIQQVEQATAEVQEF